MPASLPSGSLRSPTFKSPNTVVYAGLLLDGVFASVRPPATVIPLPPCIDCNVNIPAAPVPTDVSTVLLLRANPCASIIPEAFVLTKLSVSPVVVSLTTR